MNALSAWLEAVALVLVAITFTAWLSAYVAIVWRGPPPKNPAR